MREMLGNTLRGNIMSRRNVCGTIVTILKVFSVQKEMLGDAGWPIMNRGAITITRRTEIQ